MGNRNKGKAKKKSYRGDRHGGEHERRQRSGGGAAAQKQGWDGPLEQIDECLWRIPKSYNEGMNVEGRIFADDRLIEHIRADKAAEQVANVATLPGVVTASFAMPDIHWGYGFPIGGVAATDPSRGGVISPGGVGYDINCGVRLMRTDLTRTDIADDIDRLSTAMFKRVPAGVGRGGPYLFDRNEMAQIMVDGCQFLEEKGLATEADIECTEERGRLAGADPTFVSETAMKRGDDQCGTLGAGNHFAEIQVVDRIEDEDAARVMGLHEDQIVVMIHSGSRGLGYQVCEDSIRQLRGTPEKYGISLPDRQLVCAPVDSDEGRYYFGAMACAANYAWANRQLLMWIARETFAEYFGQSWESLGMELVYDVAHNIAKIERHKVGGVEKSLCVHRKGATRAFPPGHPDVTPKYRAIGQPVIIPGDMGTESWVLVGRQASMERSFGSSCHGAGRMLSRGAAIRAAVGRHIDQELREKGIIARCRNRKSLAEEQPDAYKDVSIVVDVVDRAGLAGKVARCRPLAVVKG